MGGRSVSEQSRFSEHDTEVIQGCGVLEIVRPKIAARRLYDGSCNVNRSPDIAALPTINQTKLLPLKRLR